MQSIEQWINEAYSLRAKAGNLRLIHLLKPLFARAVPRWRWSLFLCRSFYLMRSRRPPGKGGDHCHDCLLYFREPPGLLRFIVGLMTCG
jgi:hypothetical protein